MVINNCKVDTVKFVKIFYKLDLEKVGVTALSKEDLMRVLTDFGKLLLQISSIKILIWNINFPHVVFIYCFWLIAN